MCPGPPRTFRRMTRVSCCVLARGSFTGRTEALHFGEGHVRASGHPFPHAPACTPSPHRRHLRLRPLSRTATDRATSAPGPPAACPGRPGAPGQGRPCPLLTAPLLAHAAFPSLGSLSASPLTPFCSALHPRHSPGLRAVVVAEAAFHHLLVKARC